MYRIIGAGLIPTKHTSKQMDSIEAREVKCYTF
nr:MAG TPA: hypothetical protein [Caudoviricetes sp.]